MGGMGWEVGGRRETEGTHTDLGLIHTDVWQKPTQDCKAIILQLKVNNFFLKDTTGASALLDSDFFNVHKPTSPQCQPGPPRGF